jgi:protein-S-isoprenylcysteine O-methyltransferase Ste14
MDERTENPTTVNMRLLIVQSVVTLAVFMLALFGSAGTVFWAAGWIFLALYAGFGFLLTRWLLRHNPGLLIERMTGIGKPDQKRWDKIFFVVVMAIFLAWLILMPLDAVRFRWSHVPDWLRGVGVVLLLGSFYVFFLTFRENAYLSPAVRIQTERGQTVVSTGPYRYVRHPMYAATLFLWLGTTLLLGSWYGLLLGVALIGALVFRTVKEERLLQAKLPGYNDYMARVRYRFIPHIW